MKKSDAEKRSLQGNGHSCHLCCGESESSSGQDVQICVESLTTPPPPAMMTSMRQNEPQIADIQI